VTKLKAAAGLRDHLEVPCEVKLDIPDGGYALVDEAGFTYPVQASGGVLSFILPYLRASEVRELKLEEGELRQTIRLEDTGSEVRVYRGQLLVASYKYTGARMPYVYPLNAPEGFSVTEDAPRDHPHHRSLWTAHGDVNGVDFWAGEGRIRHVRFVRLSAGPAYAEIEAENSWEADGACLLREKRRIRFWNVPSGEWLIDYEVALEPEGEVVLGDTKEAGIVSLRVAPSMTVTSGGRLENSWGGVNEREVWGRRAEWCDYSGPLGNRVYGIVVFDNPSNPRFPTYWHARDYGLMTANMFGLTHFTGSGGGEMRLERPVAFKYRLFVHRGWAREAGIACRYLDWLYPPVIQVFR